MHLGGTAHALIGKNAGELIVGNDTVNADAIKQKMDSGSQGSATQGLRKWQGLAFRLKFPPTQ